MGNVQPQQELRPVAARRIHGAVGVGRAGHHRAQGIDHVLFPVHVQAARPRHVDRLRRRAALLLLRTVHRAGAVNVELLRIRRDVDHRAGDDVALLDDLRERLANQLRGGDAFHDISARARAHGVEDVLFVVETCQSKYLEPAGKRLQRARGLENNFIDVAHGVNGIVGRFVVMLGVVAGRHRVNVVELVAVEVPVADKALGELFVVVLHFGQCGPSGHSFDSR